MLFLEIFLSIFLSVLALLYYAALGMVIANKIWDKATYRYDLLGFVFIVFWLCIPLSFLLYLSAVSSAG